MKVGELRLAAQALGFTPRDQTRWLSPRQLLRTAGPVAVSSLFADFTDRREVQAALPAALLSVDGHGADGLWIDVVADLGDGFDPTYSVAWLLSRPELRIGGHVLPRADVLVFGGDEVYPTPSATAYEDRATGPYRAALPVDGRDGGPSRQPLLLAVPGNHDWYDGLTAFLRVFAQRRGLGGWVTRQRRSYFVVRLPDRWWLVGLDTQLGTYLDDPQLEYFREHLSTQLLPGDGVIVCAPSPTWVRTGLGDPDAFNSLHYFEREIVERLTDPDTGRSRPTGASVRVWISGDLHHYARYAETLAAPAGAARQLLHCGLGGAYLRGTADLPETLEVPSPQSRMSSRGLSATFRRERAWPTPERSRRLALGVFAPPPRGIVGRNPGLWRLLGLTHAFVMPVLVLLLGLQQGRGPHDILRRGAPADVLGLAVQLGGWIGAAVAVACLVPVVRLRRPRLPPGWILAVLLQLAVALAVLAAVLAVPWPAGWNAWKIAALAALGAFVLGGLVGCYALAVYLMLSPAPSTREWLFSAQSLEDDKGFLRLHLDGEGRLTIYPVLLERVCHDWDLVDAGTVGAGRQARLRPVPATGSAPRPRLIEEPVTVLRQVDVRQVDVRQADVRSDEMNVPAPDDQPDPQQR